MDELSLDQLLEWESYDRLDPIGTWRDDFRMAYLASTVTNLTISVHGKKGAKMTAPVDFMPEWDIIKTEDVPKQSVQEMKDIFLGIVSAHNKQVKGEISNTKPPRRLTSNTKGL